MILGSSEDIKIQKKKDINTKEFFRIMNNDFISQDQIPRLRYLIQDGINIDEQDELNEGKTALHHVMELHNTEIAKLLLSLGANKEIKDNQGRTALHMAAACQFTDGIRLLLNHKAEIDAIDNLGRTPLHLVTWRFPDIFELLLNEGADFTIKNNSDETALQSSFLNEIYRYWPLYKSAPLIKRNLLILINKFIEAGWERFDILRMALGDDYVTVETSDEMVTKIVAPKPQINEIVKIITDLYFNAVKMTPPSLVTRLLDAIEYPPIQECAASSSSQDCIDDEQPSVMMVTSVRKRVQRERDSDTDSENEENTKRCRI